MLSVSSCKKDEAAADSGKGNLEIEIDHLAGTEGLVLGTKYVTAGGDTVSVSKFQYFVSNIVLIKSDNSEYVVPQDKSYFLVKESSVSSKLLTLTDIPSADYKGFRFTIGVDSARSRMEESERTGALDKGAAALDMYWSWNEGYIFFKLEGNSPQAVSMMDTADGVTLHVGGYGYNGSPNNLRTAEIISANGVATVRSNVTPEMHVIVNVLDVFDGPVKLDLAGHAMTMGGTYASVVADNYKDIFKLSHIHND